MTCTIPLTRNKVAIVDDEDYPMLARHQWQAQPSRGTFYAARMTYDPVTKKRTKVYMHREITKAKRGVIVDHGDEDGLNNRRYNLTVGGYDDNGHAASRPISASGYRGVQRKVGKRGGVRYYAVIHLAGVHKYLGSFETAELASKAYDEAALAHYGTFAWTNERQGRGPAVEEKSDIPF